MTARRPRHSRPGRAVPEQAILLMLFVAMCVVGVSLLARDRPPDTRTVWERIVSSAQLTLQCFALLVGLCVLLASVEFLKQTAARYQSRRVEAKLSRLEPILRDAQAHATPRGLSRALKLLGDANEEVRQQAVSAAYALLRAEPSLKAAAQAHAALEQALLHGVGFARAMEKTPPGEDLLARVTLGAKLGAGTSDKRLAPVTSSPAALAHWIEQHRREEANPEIQVSVGYDTGSLPYLTERSRFLALYTFLTTTELSRFQALLRRPARDPNAAFGLVIRGDVVEVKYPGQSRGRRLDYVFPLPVRLSEANLAGLIGQIQMLNLGLLVACAQDLCRVLLPGAPPAWLDERRQAIGHAYRAFERRLVATLRDFDPHRDPSRIHRLVPADHGERVRAFQNYRLEECLYPHYGWVVPLYDPDTRWERLLAPLRGVEAMLLHQGAAEDGDATRGVEFLRRVRHVGYESASRIEQALTAETPPAATCAASHDPFIDPAHEAATVGYLRQVSRAVARGECGQEDLPDPVTFRKAAAYYEIDREPSSSLVAPENEP